MKQKISISIDEKRLMEIELLLDDCRFRSKSHVLEMALNKFLEELDKNGSI